MDLLDKYVNVGSKLGYEGQELKDFVSERESIDREERHALRDLKKFEIEAQIRKEEIKMKMELELNRLETERIGRVRDSDSQNIPFIKTPPMQPFREGTMNIQTYLDMFERYAQDANWELNAYAVNLSRLLSGKALDVCSRLPVSMAHDYVTLKKALLECYQLTSNDFKATFFTARLNEKETAAQFMERLKHSLNSWITLSKVDKTYESLFDMFAQNQFLHGCTSELRVFIIQQAPEGIDAMVRMAGNLLEANKSRLPRRPRDNQYRSTSNGDHKHENQQPRDSGNVSNDYHKRNNQRAGYQNPTDHYQQDEHRRSDRMPPSSRRGQSASDHDGQTYVPRNTITCLLCNKPNHVAKDCKVRFSQSTSAQPHTRPTNTHFGSVAIDSSLPSDQRDTPTYPTGEVDQHDTTCPKGASYRCGCLAPEMANACVRNCAALPTFDGFVGDNQVSILRDTGCTAVVVRSSLITPEQYTGETKRMVMIDNTVLHVPVALCVINTPFLSGQVEVLCVVNPVCDLIIGNVEGVHEFIDTSPQLPVESSTLKIAYVPVEKPDAQSIEESTTRAGDLMDSSQVSADNGRPAVGCVMATRAQTARTPKPLKPLRVPLPIDTDISRDAFIEAQLNDSSLTRFFEKADLQFPEHSKNPLASWFVLEDGLLYRMVKSDETKPLSQLMVPTSLRLKVLRLGHESAFAGHLGVKKTFDRIVSNFYWPGIFARVRRYCASCDICQRTVKKSSVSRAPLYSVPVVGIPFEKVAVDLIGPIVPVSDRGNRWILTLVDYATRYPEAIALKATDTETVAEALLVMFSRVGVPKVMVSDNGPQFVSNIMVAVARLLSIETIHSTPYHAMANGLVERMNGTLKAMLRRMCAEKPKDWDRYLQPLLFAYRETPQHSLLFSPFELLYGRSVRGPMAILRELWSEKEVTQEMKNVYSYVFELRNRLEETCAVVRDNLIKAQAVNKMHFDKRSKLRVLKADDLALVLLPTDENKLLMRWKGPFKIIEPIGINDYRIQIGDNIKVLHINMLRRYDERTPDDIGASFAVLDNESEAEQVGLDSDPDLLADVESWKDVMVGSDLSVEQKNEMASLISEFRVIFSDKPGKTNLVSHRILLSDDTPIRVRPYPIPFAKADVF